MNGVAGSLIGAGEVPFLLPLDVMKVKFTTLNQRLNYKQIQIL